MLPERENINLRIIMIGIYFNILFCVLIGRVIYIQYVWHEIESDHTNMEALTVKKIRISKEVERLSVIQKDINKLNSEKIKQELIITKKYLNEIQRKTEDELKILKALDLLSSDKMNKVTSLEKKKNYLENLNNEEIEILKSIMKDKKDSRLSIISSFAMGVLTSLFGSFLFSIRKAIFDSIRENYKLVCKGIKEIKIIKMIWK